MRIRKEPDKEADVIAIIPVGTIIELLDNDAINGFYAIHTKTKDGIEFDGYCMKDFIGIDYLERSNYGIGENERQYFIIGQKMLGLPEEYDAFDLDIITHINSAFTVLTQLGVGPADGFMIDDKTAIWSDFMPDMRFYQLVKSYVVLKVRLLFDPPISSAVLECYKTQIMNMNGD